MEYLDTYDENKNYLGKQTRNYVHSKALWHNTVHCWLYDSNGNIFYSIKTLNEGNLSDKFREELTEYWEILNLIKSERTIQNSKKKDNFKNIYNK